MAKRRILRGSRWAEGRRRRFVTKLRRVKGFTQVHGFKEWYDGGVSTIGAATAQGYVLTTQIASLNNFSSLQGLFDLYKITGMKVTFVPSHNVSDFSAGNGSGIPMLYVAPNRDPYVPAPVSVADILNDDGVKIIRFTKPVSFYLPNPKADIKDSDGKSIPMQFNSSSKALQPWLTTGGNSQTVDQSGVKHFGYRYYVDNSPNTAQPFNWNIYVKLYASFKEQD